VDDALGPGRFMLSFLPADVAQAWFAGLNGSVPWRTQRRDDLDVDVPLLLAHVRLDQETAPGAIHVAAGKESGADETVVTPEIPRWLQSPHSNGSRRCAA
jgi:hypothetical protein